MHYLHDSHLTQHVKGPTHSSGHIMDHVTLKGSHFLCKRQGLGLL